MQVGRRNLRTAGTARHAPPRVGRGLTGQVAPVLPGDAVTFSGSGFAPAARVTLVGYPLTAAAAVPGLAAAAPAPVDLGAGQATASGAFTAAPVLPGNGVWRVVALGLSPSGTPVTLAVVLVAAAGADVAPAVVRQPASVTGAVGTTVTLTATATAAGAPAPSVRWQRSTDGTTWTDVPGATGTSLDVVVPTGSESYRAVFTNAAGTVVSTVAVVSGPAGVPGGRSGSGPAGGGSAGGGPVPVVDGSTAGRGVPGAAAGGPALARTGVDVLPVLGAGAALLLAGALLLRLARRRRQEA